MTTEQYEEPSKHIVSIGNHEKGMQNAFFQSPQNEMKCILCIKDSYTKGKKVKNVFVCVFAFVFVFVFEFVFVCVFVIVIPDKEEDVMTRYHWKHSCDKHDNSRNCWSAELLQF